jgi:hypothetical protein
LLSVNRIEVDINFFLHTTKPYIAYVSLGNKEKDVGFQHVLYLAIMINYNKKNEVIHSTHITRGCVKLEQGFG